MPICGAELPDSLEELLGAEEKKGKKEGRRQLREGHSDRPNEEVGGRR
jgi:hypothetical protein